MAFGPTTSRLGPSSSRLGGTSPRDTIYATPLNNALYLDGNTFYKVTDGQNKLKIGTNFNLETRIRPELKGNITGNLEKSVVISRTSDVSLLDYYHLYLEEQTEKRIQAFYKPSFKVKFNIKRYRNDNMDRGLTLESKTAIFANEWSTIKIARIQNQIYLYINGKVEDSTVLHGTFEYPRDGTNYIGVYHQANLIIPESRTSGFFKGAIDYIKITDGNNSLRNWDFNCSLRNSPFGTFDAQIFQGTIKFFDIVSGGTSTFTNGRCDKPIVPTPTPTFPFRLLPSPTPTPTPTPRPTTPNRKPYFLNPSFIRNNQSNNYVETKSSFYSYTTTFEAKDDDRDHIDIRITLESDDPSVRTSMRVLPGRPSRCVANAPTPTQSPYTKGQKTVTLCGILPGAKSSIYPTWITVRYELTDGKPDGTTSGFYKIRVTK